MLREILDALSQQGGGFQRQDLSDIGQGVVVPDKQGYKNLAKGSLSATAGLPGDLESIAKSIINARGTVPTLDTEETFMPTSRDVGDSIGADVDSAGFGVGEIFSADPVSKIGKVAGLASLLVGKISPAKLKMITDAIMKTRKPSGNLHDLQVARALNEFDANTANPDEMANIVDSITKQANDFDPRFDDRVGQQARLHGLQVGYEQPNEPLPGISIYDLEGKPVMTTMSDRVDIGKVRNINGVELRRPIDLSGGQGNMFLPENIKKGQAWGSHDTPVGHIMDMAADLKKQTGEDPYLLPWRMSPSGSDFNKATGETMLSYAHSNMDQATIKELDTAIRDFKSVGHMAKREVKQPDGTMKEMSVKVGEGKFIPNWKGVDDPDSIQQWYDAPDSLRKELHNMMDKNFRDKGGLSLGETRLVLADALQMNAPDAGLQNVGRVHPDRPVFDDSGQPSYAKGIPGEGEGVLEEEIIAPQILDAFVDERNAIVNKKGERRKIPMDRRNPTTQDVRSLQMKPFGGILKDTNLRAIEDAFMK